MARNAGIPGLGRRLRQLRVARGLTQSELAAPYYSGAYISTIEAGKRRPSEDALNHLAQKLGTDTESLATGRPAGLVSELELGIVESRRLISSGKVRDARKRLGEMLSSARKHQLESLEVRTLYALGLAEERSNRIEKAIECYETAIEHSDAELTPASVEPLVGRARCHQLLGDVRLAIHLLESALVALERSKMEDPSAILRIRASLTAAYFEAGLYPQAYENADQALHLAPDVEDPERLAWMYLNSAWALHHRGKAREAHDTLARAEHFFSQLELRQEIGQAQLARGMLLSREGDYREARDYLQRATRTFRQVSSEINEARALNELGRLERLEGRPGAAKEALRGAARILERLDYPGLLAWTNRELGIVLSDDPELAEKAFNEALQLYERADESIERAITYRHLGDLRDRLGDSSGANQAYRAGIALLEPAL